MDDPVVSVEWGLGAVWSDWNIRNGRRSGGTHLKRDGNSHPANINKRAFGRSWPGFPRNLPSYGSEFLTVDTIRPTKQWKDRRNVRRFPLQNILPHLIQEVANVYYSLNMFFGGFPTLPHQRVVKLLSIPILANRLRVG